MAFFHGTIFSKSLDMHTSIRVIVPDFSRMQDCKILYLLHGWSGDSSDWTRHTLVERYAEEKGFAVVMPETHNSFYMDSTNPNGPNYFSYIADELPRRCEQIFGLEHVREKTFVAGLSMGGYGALKCGLSRPDRYAACASFSGAVNIQAVAQSTRTDVEPMDVKEDSDLWKLAVQTNALAEKPRILTTCGLSDFLYQDNLAFRDWMRKLDYTFTYMEWPGDHDWRFWDESLQKALDFFE